MEKVGRKQKPVRKHMTDTPSANKNPIEPSGGSQLEKFTSAIADRQESIGQQNDPETNEVQPPSLQKQEEQALLTIKRGSGSPTDFKRNFKRKPVMAQTQEGVSKIATNQTSKPPEIKVEQDFLAGFSSVELEASRILGLIGQARDLRVASDAESVGSSALVAEVDVSPPGSLRSSPDPSVSPNGSRASTPTQCSEKTTGVTSRMSIQFATTDSLDLPTSIATSHVKSTASANEVSSEPSSPESNVQEEDIRSEEEGTSSTIYRCDFPSCGKTFGRLYNLKSHTRTHTDDRPFKCEQCEQAFSRNHDLKRHQKIHSGLKPFECGGCGKKFSRMDALGRHRAKKPQCQEKSS